jgi:subtilisin
MLPPFRVRLLVNILSETKDYNHSLMNIPVMWKETMGEGVKVAILDTGLPSHPDLAPTGSKSFIPGYLADKNGHGTHVAGILAAIANNGMGVAGIAPKCQFWSGAVLGGDGSGTIQGIIDGIRWAVDEVGAKVINMSLGISAGAPRLAELENACNYAASNGVVVVCAAGNENAGVGQPACYDSVIAVAAVDANQKRASFSDFGPEVDFAAGGVDVFSTWLNNGYAKLSGTSMASPALAGVVTLILADEFKDNQKWLNKDEAYAKLKKIAYNVDGTTFDDYDGWGIPVFGNEGQIPQPNPEPQPEPQPEPPQDSQPCDCSLGFPMAKQFLDSAVVELNKGKTTEEAVAEGLKALQMYAGRVARVRARLK